MRTWKKKKILHTIEMKVHLYMLAYAQSSSPFSSAHGTASCFFLVIITETFLFTWKSKLECLVNLRIGSNLLDIVINYCEYLYIY